MIKDLSVILNVEEAQKTHRIAAMYAILGGLLFIVLPLVVISIVDVSIGRSLFAIIETPELSFGSADIHPLLRYPMTLSGCREYSCGTRSSFAARHFSVVLQGGDDAVVNIFSGSLMFFRRCATCGSQ